MYENLYVSQGEVRKSLAKTFLYMGLGLVITAITSYFLYATGSFYWMIARMSLIPFVLLISQFALIFSFTSAMRHSTAGKMKVLFLTYSIVMGITTTSWLYVFNFSTITLAFLISALYFVCLAIIGYTTKRDLTSLGTICLTGLGILLVSQLVMMLFGAQMNVRIVSIIGLLIFTGITAWDMQRLNQLLILNDGDVLAQEKISIYMALELYMDFLNIFLYILQLLSNNRD